MDTKRSIFFLGRLGALVTLISLMAWYRIATTPAPPTSPENASFLRMYDGLLMVNLIFTGVGLCLILLAVVFWKMYKKSIQPPPPLNTELSGEN